LKIDFVGAAVKPVITANISRATSYFAHLMNPTQSALSSLNSLAGVSNYNIDGQTKELAFIFATLYNASSNLTSKPAPSVKITQLTH
jgi:hypothetical protein